MPDKLEENDLKLVMTIMLILVLKVLMEVEQRKTINKTIRISLKQRKKY